MYAVNEGVEWLILTNGSNWQVYHVTGGLPVIIDLAFDVSILGDMPLAEKTASSSTSAWSRSSAARSTSCGRPNGLARRSPSPGPVVSPAVVDGIRKQLRRTTGQNIETAEITRLLRETVIRPDCLP
jgi:hypothetical protein